MTQECEYGSAKAASCCHPSREPGSLTAKQAAVAKASAGVTGVIAVVGVIPGVIAMLALIARRKRSGYELVLADSEEAMGPTEATPLQE